MTDIFGVTTDASLSDLPLLHCQVDATVPGRKIAELFEATPSLPGILVFRGSHLIGLVSRRRFHEQVSVPYGLEIFLNRPINAFLVISEQKGRSDYLVLPDTEKIDIAVRKGLERSPEAVYEPIVVFAAHQPPSNSYRLLDFQTLLLAQTHILAITNSHLQQQWQQNRQYMLKLDEERHRVKQYAALQRKQQELAQDRTRTLEVQQAELVQKNQEIAWLNERFVRLTQLLSLEGRKTFEATFTGVDGICENTAEILTAGQQLSDELRTVQQASDRVSRVSYQVRHLATKAAIVANHGGGELSGFSQIAEEISKLVNQTYQAGRQLELVAQRFEDRVQNLTGAAASGSTIARSLTQNIARMQSAISQLEHILHPADFPGEGDMPQDLFSEFAQSAIEPSTQRQTQPVEPSYR